MFRHVPVEPVDVRNATSQHDHIGVEQVDDVRDRPGEALLVAGERCLALSIPGSGSGGDVFGVSPLAGRFEMVALDGRPGQPRLDAPTAAAIARGAGQFLVARPWKRMLPFARASSRSRSPPSPITTSLRPLALKASISRSTRL